MGAHDHPRQHLPPALPARRGRDRGARRAARVLGLGRADPDRLGRLPGLLAPRHAARRRRRRRHVPLRLRRRAGALHARGRRRDPAALGSDIAMCLDICPPARRPARGARGGRAADDALGASGSVDAPRAPGQLRFGIAQGGDRPGAAAPLDRGDRRRSASTATRSAGSPSGRAATRCSRPSAGRRRSCPRTGRATSWASATPRGSST